MVYRGFPGGSVVRHLPANAGDAGSIPGSGGSPGEGNATHSSILAWETQRKGKPYRRQSMGSQCVGPNLATKQQQYVRG